MLQRVEILWRISLDAARSGDLELSTTASRSILRLCRAFAIKLPPEIKRSLCRGCSAPLVPGITASYRLRGRGGKISRVARCLLCGEIHRIEILKKRSRRGGPRSRRGLPEASQSGPWGPSAPPPDCVLGKDF